MEQLSSPELYVAKKIEANSHKLAKIREKFSETSALERQTNRHFDKMVFGEAGQVQLANQSLRLTFRYDLPAQADIAVLDQEDRDRSWRVLNNFLLENSTNKRHLELSKFIPTGYKILFTPEQSSMVEGYADLDIQICLLYGSPTSWENILALFHEVGHVVINQQETRHKAFLKSRAYNQLDMRNATPESTKIVLQEERNAWAFALKILRRIMGDDLSLKSAVLYMIHNDLQSYGDDIQQALEQNLIDSIEHQFSTTNLPRVASQP